MPEKKDKPSFGALTEQFESMQEQFRTLQEQLKLARGTRDLAPAEPSLAERIALALRVRPAAVEDLARTLKEPAGRVSSTMKQLRGDLFNAGTEVAPAWFWVCGDDATTEQINAAVKALISFRPMTFAELQLATKARAGRVSGAIVALQRDDSAKIFNLGSANKARWFLVPETASVARLRKQE